MQGPQIVAQTLSRPGKPDTYGNTWQYHSRSDRHSKVACWAVMFEALQHSALLRRHVEAGKVVFGVNQQMRDYRTNRTKNLDLVIATPGTAARPAARAGHTGGPCRALVCAADRRPAAYPRWPAAHRRRDRPAWSSSRLRPRPA